MDRRALKELREAPWRSVDEMRAFVASAGSIGRRDVEHLVGALTDPKLDKAGPLHKNRCTAFKNICLGSADPSFFAPIARGVGEADPLLRRALLTILPSVNDVSHHGVLCEQLGSNDQEVREEVAEVLREIAGPSALREFAQLVQRPAFPGRREALEIMVPKARHRALDLIEAVLASGTTPDRLRAVELTGDPEVMKGDIEKAIRVVFSAVDDKDPRVASAAFAAFSHLADEDRFVETLQPKLADPYVNPVLVEALGHVKTKRTADLLTERLRRGPAAVQLAAVSALRAIGSDHVLKGLVEALHLDDPVVRRNASDALTDLGTAGEVDLSKLLLELLASPLPHVRRTASQLAATVKSGTDLTKDLLSALRDESWWVRERVLDAIVELGLPELANGLVEFLDDENPVIRRYAVFGLLRLRDAATLGAILRTAVADPDWWVREQAVQAIGALGDERAIPYLEVLINERPDLRVAVLDALADLGAEDVLLGLGDLTASDDAAVRFAMIEHLSKLEGGKQALFYVQACTSDEDARVAALARSLLDRWQVDEDDDAAAVGLLDRLLVATMRHGADDLILGPGRRPYVKHLGQVTPISKGVIDVDEMEKMLLPILSKIQRAALEDGEDVDLSYDVPGFEVRYRINVFRQLTGLSAVFRRIHQVVPKLEELGLPDVVKSFADYPNGLVLVGGPTGSGKSTTLAALIDYVNTHQGHHIVTIEDPIEVVHAQRQSLVNQREVGTHAPSFAAALRATLRQDPDVILVGELRDRETIEFAVNAAETGHLVFATVHTTSAATSLDRLIHACEAARQPVIRSMLAESLRAVLCQQLLRTKDGTGRRVLACEILISNEAISNLVRKDKSFQLPSVLMTHADEGMRLMDDDLKRLVQEGTVDANDALLKALDKIAFSEFLEGLAKGEAGRRDSIIPGAPTRSSPPPATSSIPPVLAPTGTKVR